MHGSYAESSSQAFGVAFLFVSRVVRKYKHLILILQWMGLETNHTFFIAHLLPIKTRIPNPFASKAARSERQL